VSETDSGKSRKKVLISSKQEKTNLEQTFKMPWPCVMDEKLLQRQFKSQQNTSINSAKLIKISKIVKKAEILRKYQFLSSVYK